MLAKDILKKSRYIISDPDAERWTDKRLLSLLNEALRDCAIRTTLFIETKFVVLTNNVVDIDLSASAVKIVRAEYMDEPMPLRTFEYMDERDPLWQKEKGDTLKALVYSKQSNAQLKTYPILENAQTSNYVYNQAYGIITDISYSDIQPVSSGTLGDLGDIPKEAYIKLYYIRKHSIITDVNATVFADDLCMEPFGHYIAGHALRDNKDTQNRNIGNEEIGLYETLIANYAIEREKGYVRTNIETTYRPIG